MSILTYIISSGSIRINTKLLIKIIEGYLKLYKTMVTFSSINDRLKISKYLTLLLDKL